MPVAGRVPFELLLVAGPDRERLLHGLVTGEVRKLEVGAVTHGFITSPQGRILADYRLLARDGSFCSLLNRFVRPERDGCELGRLARSGNVRIHAKSRTTLRLVDRLGSWP